MAAALLERAAAEAKRPKTSPNADAETAAALKSSATGRPVRWHRKGVRDSEGREILTPMTTDAGSYRAGALMALATKAARTACKRYPLADLEELTMDLVEAALSRAPESGRLPQVGEIGTDDRIQRPLERDRAYLIGIARHRLADAARSEAAEVESLDATYTALGDLPSVSALIEQAEAQAHTDPNLVNPDSHPINSDVWRIMERFPTKDAGRAALSNLTGTSATRAQLAAQAGLGNPKDWHRSVKRGRVQLASLAEPVQHWTAKDWGMAEATAHLVEALGPDNPRAGIFDLTAHAPHPYRAPSMDRPWRTSPDVEAPCHVTPAQPTRARRVTACAAALQRVGGGEDQ